MGPGASDVSKLRGFPDASDASDGTYVAKMLPRGGDICANTCSVRFVVYIACMSKSTSNSGKPWTAADRSELKKLAAGNTPTRVIGVKLKRTPDAVQSQASRQKVSLKPTNQSPRSPRKSR